MNYNEATITEMWGNWKLKNKKTKQPRPTKLMRLSWKTSWDWILFGKFALNWSGCIQPRGMFIRVCLGVRGIYMFMCGPRLVPWNPSPRAGGTWLTSPWRHFVTDACAAQQKKLRKTDGNHQFQTKQQQPDAVRHHFREVPSPMLLFVFLFSHER